MQAIRQAKQSWQANGCAPGTMNIVRHVSNAHLHLLNASSSVVAIAAKIFVQHISCRTSIKGPFHPFKHIPHASFFLSFSKRHQLITSKGAESGMVCGRHITRFIHQLHSVYYKFITDRFCNNMSSLTHHGHNNQIDSDRRSAACDRVSQQVTNSLTLKQSAPWSAFNTRLNSKSQLTSPTTTTTSSSSSSISKITHCSQCDAQFTGVYRHGNMSRHFRHKHTEARNGSFPCTAYGCPKLFKRPDARLKHERKRHPELHHSPREQRRQQIQHMQNTNPYLVAFSPNRHAYPTIHCDLLMKQQLLDNSSAISTEQEGIGEAMSPLQRSMSARFCRLPQAARIVFSHFYHNLNEDAYSRFCDKFFMRWESIAQKLYSTNSQAYALYAQVLAKLNTVVHELDSTSPSNQHQDINQAYSRGISHRPNHDQQSQLRQKEDSMIYFNVCYNSPAAQAFNGEAEGQRYHKSRQQGSAIVIQSDRSKRFKRRGIDCPIYKHHLMHYTPPPCNGCSRNVMSQVRSHINRGPHGGFPPFLEQCARCKKDFVDEQLLQDHRVSNSCEHIPQLRGDIVISWAQLYLTIYPDALRVPRPYADEVGWLCDNIVTQCRLMNRTSNPLRSFLGQHQLRPQDHYSQTQNPDDNIVNHAGHSAALNHMLLDTLNLAVQNPSQDDHVLGAQGPTSLDYVAEVRYGPDDYLSYLNNASNAYLQSLADAPMHVTPEHLRFVVLQAESIIRNVLRYQARVAEESHAPSITTSASYYHDHFPQRSNSTYFMSSHRQQSQTDCEEQRESWDMSARPSNYEDDFNSTLYIELTLPSTASDLVDSTLFSHLNFSNHRLSSLASQAMSDVTHYPPGPHSTYASSFIPESQPNVPSYHDPILFSTDYHVGHDNSFDLFDDIDQGDA